jgi:hypothetical protein
MSKIIPDFIDNSPSSDSDNETRIICTDKYNIDKIRKTGHGVYAMAKTTTLDNVSNNNQLVVHTDNPGKHIAKYTAYALGNLYNEVVDNTAREVDVKRYQNEISEKNQSIEILKLEIEALKKGTLNEEVNLEDKIKEKKVEKQRNKYKARLDKINIQISCYESKRNDFIKILKSLDEGSLDDCSDVE